MAVTRRTPGTICLRKSIPIQVHSEADIENAIRKVGSEPDSGLFVLPDSHNRVHRKQIIELTAQYRVPAIDRRR